MMGPTHSMSGAAAGAGLALYLKSTGMDLSAAQVIVMTGLTAGAALLPDLDHPSATLARTWGPLSKGLAELTNHLSAAIVNMTGSRRDKHCSNGHRTFTHTFLFAALMGLATYFVVTMGGTLGAGIVFFILVSLAMQGLMRNYAREMGPIISNVVALGLAWFAVNYLPDTVSATSLGVAVSLGCVAHMVGDAVTISGVPAFAPFIPVNGKRWGDVHLLPAGARVRASGPANTIAFWLCTVAVVILLPQALGLF